MRLVSYQRDSTVRLGALRGDGIVDLQAAMAGADVADQAIFGDMTAFLADRQCRFAEVETAVANASRASVVPLDAVRLLAPVSRPGKIIGVGRNYGAHAAEGGLGRQEQPRLFVKLTTSVVGPGAPIVRPGGVKKLDWEVELAAVVGRRMQKVEEADALAHLAGFTILNDVSAREYQFDVAPPQTTFAKSMDSFTPLGPWLATASSFDGAAGHELRCWVNGQLMQQGNTADMIFSTAYVLSYASRFVTLEPGDIVATGTPSGVGHFRDPPVYLKPGDAVRMEIPGLGRLENPVAEDR